MRQLLTLVLAIVVTVFSFPIYAEEAPKDTFAMTTDAFLDTGALPVLYTCDGKDISPQVEWSHVPAKAKSLALILTDPQAPKGTFYHWILYNIPLSVKGLPQDSNKLPAGIVIGKNSFNQLRYNGPCPPKGSAHTYSFTLYALDGPISVPAGATGADVEQAMSKHIIDKTVLTTVYTRWLQ